MPLITLRDIPAGSPASLDGKAQVIAMALSDGDGQRRQATAMETGDSDRRS